MINITIDGIKTSVPEGSTILEAAADVGIDIPTLCYHPDQTVKANCRVCVCEVDDNPLLQAACSQPVYEGMNIKTRSPKVIEARKTILELILSHHPQDCLTCIRNKSCELQDLADEYLIRDLPFEVKTRGFEKDESTPSLFRDHDKCILCRRCIDACNIVQSVGALEVENRGCESMVVPTLGGSLKDSPCVMCGQCVHACPVGAIGEVENIDKLLAAIADPDKVVVTQMAPAVRVALGEEIGMHTGELDMEVLVAGLRKVGFDHVLHTNFTADLTIMEEGSELLQRLTEGGTLPMFTSCSPGWVVFCETFYPDLMDHLSTCKSPQQMFGALVKTYWAEKMDIPADKIVSVSIMPCIAKKFEAQRPEMNASGYRDVDIVLTTREVGKLLRMTGIDFDQLAPDKFDSWMGSYTGAGVIFGATGGVMEAALRTVYEIVTKRELEDLNFEFARGFDGIKHAEIDLDGTVVKVAIAHTLAHARTLMDQVRAGESPYHFIEVMACPGGCIGGGGQPYTKANVKRLERIKAIYAEEEKMAIRKSHDNPEVKKLYEEFLQEPLGHKSHELLHTHYNARPKKAL
ncbi:MAG TPA: 2Fe-2S iron-sulfur cluster binding domain-containing protein [Clostridiaceae bacterium]|nr:2Fe-2S iron-sulfur cluster binding domain-containing protein [Clostridiaceae bacterium]